MALVPAEIVRAFRSHFGESANPLLYRAPGRVNLIGEHTDYNLGFVLPIALEMACYAAFEQTRENTLRIFSRDLEEEITIDVPTISAASPAHKWSDYVVGVAQQLSRSGYIVSGGNLFIASEVPVGSGLSSSAALEIASAFALLNGQHMDPLDIALAGQRAESQFVGMPCGIMDQYASVFGREDSAIKIDCRSLEHEYVTLPRDVAVIAVNSMVKHELGSSAYRDRVAECQQAVAAIQKIDSSVKSLRDVTTEFFVNIQESIPPLPRQRARHVVFDTQRVVDFGVAAQAHDLAEMGKLFVASHRSMQYDYEISCEEIDFLVDTAIKIPCVYGSRMTGGGFGGCTVNLVAPGSIEEFQQTIARAYQDRYALVPAFYDCHPAAGAGPYAA